ncbi:MAG: hypothetical protein H7A23_24890 [Leptospiraceae bacterium]|nr:hypothetical protein [Leptospiraceae bacterium]MCP5497803.1 hypothetical protein [Leptospiraceae bacterium]
MTIKQYVQYGIGLLFFFNILIIFGVIGLFMRMSPAIEEIIHENVHSLEAVEEMLLATNLIILSTNDVTDEKKRFLNAFQKAKMNITEEEEKEVIQNIERNMDSLFLKDKKTIARLITNIEKLAKINRVAMKRADGNAKRLGIAGSWSGVFLGVVNFILSVLITRKLDKRFFSPLSDVYDVLMAHKKGDKFRRCVARKGSAEMKLIKQEINLMLDDKLKR